MNGLRVVTEEDLALLARIASIPRDTLNYGELYDLDDVVTEFGIEEGDE